MALVAVERVTGAARDRAAPLCQATVFGHLSESRGCGTRSSAFAVDKTSLAANRAGICAHDIAGTWLEVAQIFKRRSDVQRNFVRRRE
jgi:hypothetical protein